MRVGGVVRDIDDKFVEGTRDYIKWQRSRMPMYDKLVTGNIIFRKRIELANSLPTWHGVTG